jgi:hypothetical protein
MDQNFTQMNQQSTMAKLGEILTAVMSPHGLFKELKHPFHTLTVESAEPEAIKLNFLSS